MTVGEFELAIQGLHKNRWRALKIWIVVFTVIVFFVLWQNKHQQNQRAKDRNDQIAAIVDAGHQECVHAFTGLTTVLTIVFPKAEIARLSPAKKKLAAKIFATADPTKQCPPASLSSAKEKTIDKIKGGK